MVKRIGLALVGLGMGVAPAFAHLNPAEHGSFAAGFSHPLFGLDHFLAMVAVGLWAALLARGTDRRAVWLVPAAFVGTMLAGFGAAIAGAPLPFVEPVILASVVAIGLLAAVALSVPTVAAMAMVGSFAIFHGHAHGGELGEAGVWPFAIGFAAATALLHAAGVLFGIGVGGRYVAARTVGALTAAGGLWLAFAG